jgi:uncharacterized membrane protein YfcA
MSRKVVVKSNLDKDSAQKEDKLRNSDTYAWKYLTIGMSTVGSSLLPTVAQPAFLRVTGFIFLVVALVLFLSSRIEWRRLVKVAENIQKLPVSPLLYFFPFYGFAVAIMHANYFLPGVFVAFVAYIIFGSLAGIQLGKALRHTCNKFNILMPSSKIPKDI